MLAFPRGISNSYPRIMSSPFLALGISPDLIKGLEELGIAQPTKIQNDAIPPLMQDGRDFIAQAQTGTGKTAAFGLPLLMKTVLLRPVLASSVRDIPVECRRSTPSDKTYLLDLDRYPECRET